MSVGAFQPKSCRECPKWGIDMSQCPKCEIRLNYDRVQSDYTQLGDYKVVDNSENLIHPESKIDDPVDNLINSICLEHKVLRSMLTDKTLHTISDKRKLRPVRERLAQELNKIKDLPQSKIAEIIGVKKGSLWTYLDPSKYKKTNKPKKKSESSLSIKNPTSIKEKTDMESPENMILTIDFSGCPDIFKRIVEVSEQMERTPEAQIRFWLKNTDFEKMCDKIE